MSSPIRTVARVLVGVIASLAPALAGVAASGGLVAPAAGCAGAHSASAPGGTGSLRRAREELHAARLEGAQREFSAAVDTDPHSMAAWQGLVEASERAGTLGEIAGRVERRARDGPEDGTAWYALGLLRSAQRRNDEAGAAFSRAASIKRDDAEIQYRWGAALLAADRAAEARRPLSRALELAPDDAAHRVALAACLAALGERAAAMEALRDVPRLSPSAADARRTVRLARALTDPFRNVRPEERAAVEPVLRELERDASAPPFDRLEAVLARFPAFAAGHLLVALAAERLGDSPRAFAEFRMAAALAPDLPQPHAYLARISVRDRPELSAEEYAEALKRNPLDPGALRGLGEIDLDRLGRPDRAAESLRRAAELVPDDPGLQALAVRAELTAGFSAAAHERVAKAIRGWRRDPQLLLRLAAAAYDERSKAVGEAVHAGLTQCIDQVLDAIQEVDPENAVARGLRRAARER